MGSRGPRRFAIAVVALATLAVTLVVPTLSAGAAVPLTPTTRWARDVPADRTERASALHPSGLVAWYAPGVGTQIARDPGLWTTAGVWDLNADTSRTLTLPVIVSPYPVVRPVPMSIDAAGDVLGTVQLDGPFPNQDERRLVRWDPTGNPTVLDPPPGVSLRLTEPMHVVGDIALANGTQAGSAVIVRWDGNVPTLLAGLPDTSECILGAGLDADVVGSCYDPARTGRTATRWDVVADTVDPVFDQPLVAPEPTAAFDVDAGGNVLIGTGADRMPLEVAADGIGTMPVPFDWVDQPVPYQWALDAHLLQGDAVAVDASLALFSSCPCRTAVLSQLSGTPQLSWIDPLFSPQENTVDTIGQLDDGTIVTATSLVTRPDQYGAYVQHAATGFYQVQPRTQFPDVAIGSTFFNEIARAVELGYVTGTLGGDFEPLRPVTRQTIVALLIRSREAYGMPAPPPCTTPPFTDVPVGSTFCPEIAEAADMGWVEGYPDGTFRPTQPVVRQHLAAVLYRSSGPVPNTCTPKFFDVPIDSPFCSAITWASNVGIVNGFPDGNFLPFATTTRQTGVTMVQHQLYLLDPILRQAPAGP